MKKFSKLALVLWAASALFFLVSFSFIPKGQIGEFFSGIVLAAVLGFVGWIKRDLKTSPTPQNSVKPQPQVSTTLAAAIEDVEYRTFNVSGVTFKNGRKSRQTILRKIKWRDEEFADGITLTVKEETFEDRPAVGIYANDQQIGYAPADLTMWIVENWERIVSISNLEIVGGGNLPSGEVINFGAKVTIKLSK